MKIVADEDVAAQIVEALRADGHDVTYLAELAPSTQDSTVLSWATTENALLITSDKDFGELVYRLGEQSGGVLLLRLHNSRSRVEPRWWHPSFVGGEKSWVAPSPS